MDSYDLIILGAGPAGLALAQCCCNINKKILIIEKETTIGGCHRVKRTKNGLFTEHGPRIYLSIYQNLFNLLKEMGIKQEDIFTDYHHNVPSLISKQLSKVLRTDEILSFLQAYCYYIFNDNYGKNVSLKSFCLSKNYSKEAIDILDRICRFSDGAGIEKFSLNVMLKATDTPFNILQPKKPLDEILFNKWQMYLENRHVTFALGHTIKTINYNQDTNKVDYIILDNNQYFYTDNLVLAIPPANLIDVLKYQSEYIRHCFGNIYKLRDWAEETEYIEYISITYHYKNKVNIPKIFGYTTKSDWGVIMINITDYMQDIEKMYLSVLSVAITICNKPSKHLRKTANQCTDPDEIAREAFRQLKVELFPDLPEYDKAILNPNNYYDQYERKWKTTDEAFYHVVNTPYIPNTSAYIKNIYNVGTHNGHHHIDYTTMESAVSNGISLSCKLYPQLKAKYKLLTFIRYKDILIYILIFLVLCIGIWIILKIYT